VAAAASPEPGVHRRSASADCDSLALIDLAQSGEGFYDRFTPGRMQSVA
jgi:hypothetical protein